MKKIILFFMACIFLSSPVWATTYYIDCNANGDAGAGTGTGAAVAWKTIAKVNASSFSAGDSILFNKGCTWREQLTVPSSGSAGSPITFGAYGSGANPRITGGAVVTTWTAGGGDTWNIDDNFDDNNTTGWTVSSAPNVVAQNQRLEVAVANSSERSAKQATTAASEFWAYFTVNYNNLSVPNNNDRVIGAGVFSGINSILALGVINSSGTLKYFTQYATDASYTNQLTSNVVATLATVHSVVMHFKAATAAGANNGILKTWVDGVEVFSVTNGDTDTLTANTLLLGDRWGTNCTGTLYYDNAKLGPAQASDPNLYTATLAGATEAKTVVADGVKATAAASSAACTSNNLWYHDTAANKLYFYSTTDANARVIEASQRATAITVNAKQYVTIDGLRLDMSNDIWPSGAVYFTGNVTGGTVQNCEINNSGYGIYGYSGTGTSLLIVGNTISGIDQFGMCLTDISAGSGTEGVIRSNMVRDGNGEGIQVRSNYWIIENNTVHDVGNTTNRFEGIHTYTLNDGEGLGTHVTIRRNLVYNVTGLGNDGIGICVDQWCDYNDVYYNIVYNTKSAGIVSYDASHVNIYNNIVYNGNTSNTDDIANFKLSSSALTPHSVTVKNNISYAVANTVYAIVVDNNYNGATDIVITNNIWYAPNRIGGNWYYWNGGAGNNLTTWNALTEVGTDLNADPLFTSATNFHLMPHSPAIDAGVGVGLTSDYNGAKVPQRAAPSIGAYEYIRKIIGHRIMPGITPIVAAGENLFLFESGDERLLESGENLLLEN